MWRKIWTERSLFVIDRFLLSSSRTTSSRRRLFFGDFAATTSTNCNAQPNQTTKGRPRLPVEIGRFHTLDKELREKTRGKYEAYQDVADLQKRAPNFTIDDWRDFMNAIIAIGIRRGRIYFSSNQLEPMTKIVSYLANFCEQFEPNDYCNYVRLLLNFEYGFSDWHQLPVEVQDNVCRWFMKNFDRLEPSAFFEILFVKTQWLEERKLLKSDPLDDVLKFLEHGVTLATKSSGISASLRMLHMIECYKKVIDPKRLAPSAGLLIDTLTRNIWPDCQRDLCSSLKFVAGPQHRDMTVKKMKTVAKTQDVFRRYVCGSKSAGIRATPQAAWQWLRNSIEMTFESDEFDHLRQLAAVAAIDAFKYKAINFTAGELARFLISASEPFMNNPMVVLEPMRTDVASIPRTVALKLLLSAICRGLLECKDPRLFDLLWSSSTRFDQLYWDRFWNTLVEEAPKRLDLDDRRLILAPLSELNRAFHMGETLRLHYRDRMVIRKPLDQGSRRYLLRCLTQPEPNTL